ncbi:MAG: hypothetical protein ACREJB_09490 [Planctomycetaceae bacterium]
MNFLFRAVRFGSVLIGLAGVSAAAAEPAAWPAAPPAPSAHPGLVDGHVSFYGHGTGYYLPNHHPTIFDPYYYSAVPREYPGDHVHGANRLWARHHHLRGIVESVYYWHGLGIFHYDDRAYYAFPYYNYRRAWYYPGLPDYTRDTNYPW